MTDKPKLGVVSTLPLKKQESAADRLRALADRMDSGYYGEILQCVPVWLCDNGLFVDAGYSAADEAHFLLTLGQRSLVDEVLYGGNAEEDDE